MSQNTLIEKITQEAADKVAEIKKQGQQEVDNIKRELEAELKNLKADHENSLAKQQEHNELVAISKARQEGNIAVQSVRRKQLDAIFRQAVEEMLELPSEAYVDLFATVVSSAVPTEAELIMVSAPAGRQAETKDILDKVKLSSNIEITNDIKAGLIVEAKDGLYDLSLERILNERRDELEMRVVSEIMK